jgi:hypothetical protein
MSGEADDPRCPECGGRIGQTATYCMHCSADLTEQRDAADADDDGVWDQADTTTPDPGDPAAKRQQSGGTASPSTRDEGLLAPDGIVDDTLTVVVGIGGGLIVGVVGTFTLLVATSSGWAVAFGLVAWLGATAYLVRRRTVQAAVANTGYAVALVLLAVPVIALSPAVSVEGGIGERVGFSLVLLLFVVVPAGVAAVIGWTAAQFVPEDTGDR